MWPTFGNSTVSMTEVYFNFVEIWPENSIFWETVLIHVQEFETLTRYNLKTFNTVAEK